MKTVIFDMDGVIFDTEKMIIDIYIRKAKKYNLENIEEVCVRCIGLNHDANLEVFKREYPSVENIEEIIDEVSNEFKRDILEKGPIKKHYVNELLSFLKENGFKIGLASSTKFEMVKKELEIAGIIDYFDVVIGGDMVKKSKPQPDIFLLALEKIGSKAEESYIIEDSINGTLAGVRAKGNVIMVPDFVLPSEEILKENILVLKDLEEVYNYINEKISKD